MANRSQQCTDHPNNGRPVIKSYDHFGKVKVEINELDNGNLDKPTANLVKNFLTGSSYHLIRTAFNLRNDDEITAWSSNLVKDFSFYSKNVVNVYSFDSQHIEMEHIKGEPFYTLDSSKKHELFLRSVYGGIILDLIEFSKERNLFENNIMLVHNDLSPKNLMLSNDELVLIDPDSFDLMTVDRFYFYMIKTLIKFDDR